MNTHERICPHCGATMTLYCSTFTDGTLITGPISATTAPQELARLPYAYVQWAASPEDVRRSMLDCDFVDHPIYRWRDADPIFDKAWCCEN